MTSLRNHPSFKYLIQRCFPRTFCSFSFIKKVFIGHLKNSKQWNLKIEIEECGYENEVNDNLVFNLKCIRDDDIYMTNNIIYEQKWIVPYDYEYIMKNIDNEMSDFLKKIHELDQCLHCGMYVYNEIAFEDKCLSCGLQNLYDKENSESICTICMESIGYGKVKTCNNKHMMHIFCFIKYTTETNKDVCPLRCGSLIE